jgi:Zn-dependent protease
MHPRYLPDQEEHEVESPPAWLPPDDYQYVPAREQRGVRDVLRRIWAPIAAAGAFAVKYGAFLFKAKFLFSIFISFGVYLWIGGPWFAFGLIVLLFVHEMGHVVEAKRQGLPVSAPMFIPLMGALITLKQNPRDAWHEARLALAGPILGSVGAAAFYVAGIAADSNRLKAIAFLGFFINLFNLLPIVPLDGGRAVAALHPALWLVGLVGLGGLVVLRPNPILILILVFAAMELWRRWQMRGDPAAMAYYRVLPWQRLAVAAMYFGLAAVLVLGMHETHVPRNF